MSNTTDRATALSQSNGPSGDVIGGALLAGIGLLHLFVLQIGGWLGIGLLVVVWPLLGGVIGGTLAIRRDGETSPQLAGAITGVFGAVTTVVVTMLAGFAGLWNDFITTTFGTEIVPVAIAMTMILVITWTVFGFVGGYAVRDQATDI